MNNAAHGSATILREGRVLLIEVHGSWNLEGYLDFANKFKAAAQPIISSHWGVIVDIRDWGLSTPDTQAAENDLQLWTLRNNQRWRAFVTDENQLKAFQVDKGAEPVSHEIGSRYFQSIEAAREWFDELGLF